MHMLRSMYTIAKRARVCALALEEILSHLVRYNLHFISGGPHDYYSIDAATG